MAGLGDVHYTTCSKCGGPRIIGKKCVPCEKKRKRLWAINNPDRVSESRRKRNASGANYACVKAWRKKNPDKLLEQIKRYNERHPEIRQKINRKWLANNPEKNRINNHRKRARRLNAAGSTTLTEWQSIVEKQRGRCAVCGLKRKLTQDHIIPLAKGGSNFAFNIQGLCRSCNCRKHATLKPGAQHSLFDRT